MEPAAAEAQSKRVACITGHDEKGNSMTVLEQKPLTLSVPLREEPAGVLRVGESRVLLELVLRAYQRGASPQEIVRMYDSLALGDVFAVIAYYLAHPAELDEDLRKSDEGAEDDPRAVD